MDINLIIARLEKEWEQPDGFLGKLRLGKFDPEALERLLDTLQCVDFKSKDNINRRFVALTWYIPIFMTWQKERVQEQGGNLVDLERATNRVQGILEDILGVP
jgi:hypothetical protein